MRKLKVFVSVCLLATTLPTSAFANYKLDQDDQGVDIVDVAKALQNSQAMQVITGKSTYDQTDVRSLLSQVAPFRAAPTLGKVTGIVTDETGAVVIGADITLDGVTTIQTNVYGHFEFNNIPVTYLTSVHIHKDGYSDVDSDLFNILTGSTRDLGTMILRKIPTYGSVSGYVYGPNQVALASATVTVAGLTPTLTALTDSSGFFSLSNVPTGERVLTVTKDTYVGLVSEPIRITTNNPTIAPTFYLEKVTVPPVTGSITGLIQSGNNQPLSDALVTVTGTTYAILTDEYGQFTLTDLPSGDIELSITKAGYETVTLSSINLSAGQIIDLTTITMNVARGSVSGKITLAVGDGPASVHIQETGKTVTTDTDGNFTISNLPVGSYTLQITAENYTEQTIPVTVWQNENASVNISLVRTLANVDGVAITSFGPVPQGTLVTIPDTIYTAFTDADGKFKFNNLPAGYTIQSIAIEDYMPKMAFSAYTVTATGTNSIGTIEFLPSGVINGSVRDGESFLANISVTLLDSEGNVIKTSTTDANGWFDMGKFPVDASYTLTVEKAGYAAEPRQLTVHTGYNFASFYLRSGAAVRTESEFLAAYANTNVPYILLLNDIHLSNSFEFNRNVELSGVYIDETHMIQLTAPTITILLNPFPQVSFSRIDMYSDVGNNNDNLDIATKRSFLSKIKVNGIAGYEGFIIRPFQKNYFLSEGENDLIAFVNSYDGFRSALLDERVSRIYNTSDIYFYDEDRTSTSGSIYFKDIRNGLEFSQSHTINYQDLIDAGLINVEEDELDLYRYALIRDQDTLLSASTNEAFINLMQEWVDTVNAAPVIQRILWSNIDGIYDWSPLNDKAEQLLNEYDLDGIYSSSQLAVAEHLMEQAFENGEFKLLTKAAMQDAIDHILPSPEFSYFGDRDPQGLGTNRVKIYLKLKNSNGDLLIGYTADDFTIKVDGVETSLDDTEVFPSFTYDDEEHFYQFEFEGSESSRTYMLSNLALNGTNVVTEPLSVTTPAPGVLVTSIGLSQYSNSDRIQTGSSSALRVTINPYGATNKNIVWSIAPNGIATVTDAGVLNVTGIGQFTVTATNPASGISQSLVLKAVDSEAALLAVQNYAASVGTTQLTLDDLKNTCVGNIVDSAFEIYKKAILAKSVEFQGLATYQVSNLLQSIITDYTYSAPLNQMLYDYMGGNTTTWNALESNSLIAYGVVSDTTNFQYVKQVILDTFMQEGKPFTSMQLNALTSKVPSFAITGFSPTTYATQMVSQHLNSEGTNVIVTFKVSNMFREGNTSLASQDVKATIGSTARAIDDTSMFTNFQNLGGGLYSFEVLQSVLSSPLVIDTLTVRAGYTDVPIATNVSVNRQAALIEQKVADHTLNIEEDEQLFAAGNLPDIAELSWNELETKLAFVYQAHGAVLTEGTIRRIINGMRLITNYYVTTADSIDTYHLEFDQDIQGSLYYSVSARNEIGYLYRRGTNSYSNKYNFDFGQSSTYPVVLTYIATADETLRFTETDEAVLDFEIIFIPSY